jgi:hypothetical protein
MTHETDENRADARWLAPVWVRVGSGFSEPVRSPAEALEKLTHRWPGRRGRHYLGAKTCCAAALTQQMSAELAREAFIQASIESEMLD